MKIARPMFSVKVGSLLPNVRANAATVKTVHSAKSMHDGTPNNNQQNKKERRGRDRQPENPAPREALP